MTIRIDKKKVAFLIECHFFCLSLRENKTKKMNISELKQKEKDWKLKYQLFIEFALSKFFKNTTDFPIELINDLCEDDFCNIRNCGKKTIVDMNRILEKYNVAIKNKKEDKINKTFLSLLKEMPNCNVCCLNVVCLKLKSSENTNICKLTDISKEFK